MRLLKRYGTLAFVLTCVLALTATAGESSVDQPRMQPATTHPSIIPGGPRVQAAAALPVELEGLPIVFSSDLVTTESNEVFLTGEPPFDSANSSCARITFNSVDDREPQLSPDGERIVFSRSDGEGNYDIFVRDVDDQWEVINCDQVVGGSVAQDVGPEVLTPIAPDPLTSDEAPAWSPDGTRIAWERHTFGIETEEIDIWVANADGTSAVNLTNDPATYDTNPTWSPDGERIAYISQPIDEGFSDIWIIDSDPDSVALPVNRTQSTFTIEDDPAWRWTPDGSLIAYAASADSDFDIYVLNPDTMDSPVLLTPESDVQYEDFYPAWSPGGTRIVFQRSFSEGDTDLWIMDADGSNVYNITAANIKSNQSFAYDFEPHWSPLDNGCGDEERSEPETWFGGEGGGNGHEYQVVLCSAQITWLQACEAAQEAGGYLATLTSAEENGFVLSLANSFSENTVWWVGGLQAPPEPEVDPGGHWHWVTGETWTYTNWFSGEPDENSISGEPENYLVFNWLFDGQWNDMANEADWDGERTTNPTGYIIEYSDDDSVCMLADADQDGVLDEDDNCVTTPNPVQEDTDNDGVGDACDEEDPPEGVEPTATFTPTPSPTATSTPVTPTATTPPGTTVTPPAGTTSTTPAGAGTPTLAQAQQTPPPITPSPATTPPAGTPTPSPTPTQPPVPTPPQDGKYRPELVQEVLGVKDISFDAEVLGANAIFAGLFVLFILVDSAIFNSTIKENHDDISDFFAPIVDPLMSVYAGLTVGSGGGAEGSSFLKTGLLLGITGLIYSLLTPDFGFNNHTLVLVLALVIGLAVTTYVYDGGQVFFAEKSFGIPAAIKFFPIAVLIACISVLISRVGNLHPGVVYGFIASAVLLRSVHTHEEGRILYLSMLALSIAAMIAWFLIDPFRSLAEDGTVWGAVLEAAVIAVFLGGIQGALFTLTPLEFMDGSKIWRWSPIAWILLAVPLAFIFFHFVLHQSGTLTEAPDRANIRAVLWLCVICWSITIATWVYFKARHRIAHAQ